MASSTARAHQRLTLCAAVSLLLIPLTAQLLLATNGRPLPAWGAVAALSAAFVAADLPSFRVRVRGTLTHFTLFELAMAVGLQAVGAVGTAIAFVIAVSAVAIIQRPRPVHFALEFSFGFAGVALAAWIYELALAKDSLVVHLAALLVGAVAFSLISGLALVAHRLTQGTSVRSLGSVTVINSALALLNTVLAVIVVELVRIDLVFIPIFAALAALAYPAYRNHLTLVSNNGALQSLHRVTGEIQRVGDGEDVYQHLLSACSELVGARRVEMVLDPLTNPVSIAQSQGDDDGVIAGSSTDEVAILLGSTEQTFSARANRISGLMNLSDGRIALLRAEAIAGSSFADGDRWMFGLFLNHASVAIENGELVEQLRLEARSRAFQARHDALTGLPNRVRSDEVIAELVAANVAPATVAVVLIDLDRFKEVNDTLGHQRGDELLQALARRLEAIDDPEVHLVARLGGDEFVIIVESESHDRIESIATAARSTLEQPIEIDGVPIDVTASFGVAEFRAGQAVPYERLLQQADVAMYQAKDRHLGVKFYDPEDDPYSPTRLSLAADLRRAVRNREVEAWFQPKISTTSGHVVGVEALARWTHPILGRIPPDTFIPVAEQSGLIRQLTYDMFERCLDQLHRLHNEGFQIEMAVNLSVRCLSDPALLDEIGGRLRLAGIDPHWITLEVTESLVMADPDKAAEILGKLRDLGVSLSLDDFGTGQASLAQLKRLPLQQLKIDKEFVLHMASDHQDEAIVRSVIDLGHHLEMEVVAEGVEDARSLQLLAEHGCDVAQGFFVSRPVPFAELQRWLRDRRDRQNPAGRLRVVPSRPGPSRPDPLRPA